MTRIECHKKTEVEYAGGGVRVTAHNNGSYTIVVMSGFGEQSIAATPEQLAALAEILMTIATEKK